MSDTSLTRISGKAFVINDVEDERIFMGAKVTTQELII
ncbi:Uncharacterised protein [Sphingobacterium spiritivorum]|nr:Uncharacterised protein [Sphingobacterium spiritivorum]